MFPGNSHETEARQLAMYISRVALLLQFYLWPSIEAEVRSRVYQCSINRVLLDHVISRYVVPSEVECGHKCIMRDNCQLYNYQRTTSGCEINNTTREDHHQKFVENPDYSYCGEGISQVQAFISNTTVDHMYMSVLFIHQTRTNYYLLDQISCT